MKKGDEEQNSVADQASVPLPALVEGLVGFTPGPWQAEMHGQNVLACNQQMMIANVRGWGYLTGTGGLNLPESEAVKIQDANVRLIAAAPTLLQERNKLLEVLETRAEREMEMLAGVAAENDALVKALHEYRAEHDVLWRSGEVGRTSHCPCGRCIHARAALAAVNNEATSTGSEGSPDTVEEF